MIILIGTFLHKQGKNIMTTPEKNEDKIEIDEFNDEEKKKVTYLQKEEDEKDD